MNVDTVESLVSLAFFAGASLIGLPVGLLLGATVRSSPPAELPSRRESRRRELEVSGLAARDAETLPAKRGAL
jgi:hypothetical protein